MAVIQGRCENCHQSKPVIAHDWLAEQYPATIRRLPPVLGMVWLCLHCGALLKVRERLRTEVQK